MFNHIFDPGADPSLIGIRPNAGFRSEAEIQAETVPFVGCIDLRASLCKNAACHCNLQGVPSDD